VQKLEQSKEYLNNTIIETSLGDAYRGLSIYSKAERAYKCAANMIPSRFYPEYLLANLYYESNQSLNAYLIAKKLLNKEIRIPSIAILEIQEEMREMIKNLTKRKSEF